MGRKKKQKKTEDLDEFRKLRSKEAKGHLHYVSARKGKNLESLGITHSKRTKGKNNVPLKSNPDKKDKAKAYIRPQLTEEKAEKYGRKLDGLGLSEEDKKTVWALIERLRAKNEGKKKK